MFIILWDVKQPAHLAQRVGHVVPGVVVCLCIYFFLYYSRPCVRKLFTGLIMYYPLKIKNIVLYCIVLYCIVLYCIVLYQHLLNQSQGLKFGMFMLQKEMVIGAVSGPSKLHVIVAFYNSS